MSSQDIIDRPTSALSPAKRALLDARLKGLRRDAPAIPHSERRGDAPPSFGQERLWFIERVSDTAGAYNVSAAFLLTGALDRHALEQALGEIVRRHDVLRTTFAAVDGLPVQRIAPFTGFALAIEDLSTEDTSTGRRSTDDPASRDLVVERRAAAHASLPFDLATGPLFRATLLGLARDVHALLLGLHHVAVDEWSLRILFRELSILYGAYREGRPSPLPELALQYADYAAWQRQHVQGERLARQMAYWQAQLAGAPDLLALPTDRPRPAVQSHRGAQETITLPFEVLPALQALARREQATLFMVLLAAYQVLLARYTGAADIVVGSPIAGRTRRELEGLLGFFVNMLVLRVDLAGDPSFSAALRRVRAVTLDAYEHQDVPFERLVAALRPERARSHAPLFQAAFMLQEGGGAGLELSGLRVRAISPPLDTEKYDLSLTMAVTRDGLRGRLNYAVDLFERDTIARMGRHLSHLLAEIARDPDRPLSALTLLDAGEREQVVSTWNRTETAQTPTLVHQRIEAQAARTPDAIAVTCGDAALSYRALDTTATRLAARLRRLGVGPEVRVGIHVEPGAAMIAAVLGVLKAGGAYVPLDTAYPVERLEYMLADSGARVLITERTVRTPLAVPPGVMVMDVVMDVDDSSAAVSNSAVPGNLVYVLYTSGSTGQPKGVTVDHATLDTYLAWAVRTYPARTALLHSSLSFDFTVTPLFVPLLQGGRVEVLREPIDGLARRLAEGGPVDLLKLTPSHLQALGDLLDARDVPHGAACLVVGGEALLGEHLDGWRRRAPQTIVINEYGPTETVVGCAIDVRRLEDAAPGRIPIGRPVPNTRLYVLDAADMPAPVGVPGELFIGGAQVTRGYLGRPGLTAARFGPDPFATTAGARCYRTGDRARWCADGTLDYLGRRDDQVKIRGFRIEPGEVAIAIRRHPDVSDCTVLVREDAPGEKRLVAYVISSSAGAVAVDALREHASRHLPEYMVPTAFVAVDRFPLTSNGKLDRGALPAPPRQDARERTAPKSFIEVQLIQIWEALLGVEVRHPEQSFFELGGHSLLAMRLLAEIQRRFGCDAPIATLFTGATVRQMANAIQSGASLQAPSSALVPLQPHGTCTPPLFLVHTANGRVICYVHLVRHLGADRPIWGLQDVGRDMRRPVTDLAADYVREVRAVQPDGPYALAGWSFGGLIAQEMARLIEQAGQRVAFLGLFDTGHPALTQTLFGDELDTLLDVAHELAVLAGRELSMTRDELEPLGLDARLDRVVAALHRADVSKSIDAATLRGYVDGTMERAASARGFAPADLAATITLFRATDNTFGPAFSRWTGEEQRTLGWSRVSSALDIVDVPGAHDTMIGEPHVRALAPRMRERVEAALPLGRRES